MHKTPFFPHQYEITVALQHTHAPPTRAMENVLKIMRRAKWQYAHHRNPHPLKYKLFHSAKTINHRTPDQHQWQPRYHALLLTPTLLPMTLPTYLKFFHAVASPPEKCDRALVLQNHRRNPLPLKIILYAQHLAQNNPLIFQAMQDLMSLFFA